MNDWYYEGETFARISAQAGGRMTMEILRPSVDQLTTLVIGADGSVRGVTSRKIKQGKAREFDGMVPYWYETEDVAGDTGEATFAFKRSLHARRAGDRILSPARAMGMLDFNPCDGCEHGDQFLIEDKARKMTVNVVEIGFGSY